MSQWGGNDASSNAVLWAPVPFGQAPNTANRDALYGNTTANGYGTHETIGLYGVDAAEIGVRNKTLSAVSANGGGTSGSYVPGEILTIDATGATATQNATVRVLTTEVRAFTITDGGEGFANGDTVELASGAGSNAGVFTVTTGAADDAIASLALTARGSFTTNPDANTTVNVLTGSGNGAAVDITAAMRIATLGIANPGKYSVVPTTTANNTLAGAASGNGAMASLTFGAVGSADIAHTGWVLRKVGTGGRAGRVMTEVLVAGGITGDGSDDGVLPDS
jgi:hypothetical protein